MEYMSDKFAMKSQALKGDYYMGSEGTLDQVMDGLDAVQYYNKSSPKCVQAFSLQNSEHHTRIDRSSPCDNQNSKFSSHLNTSLCMLIACDRLHILYQNRP